MEPAEVVFGYILFLLSFVFFDNGVALLGKTGVKEIGVLNLVVGILISIAAWNLHTYGQTNGTAIISVFALICFMIAGIYLMGYDAKGLGWSCLYAFVVFLWFGSHFLKLAGGVTGVGMVGVFCCAWALLFILVWLATSLGKPIATTVGWLFIIESILTLLIPGILLIIGSWHPFTSVKT
jgi:hypothetical protein